MRGLVGNMGAVATHDGLNWLVGCWVVVGCVGVTNQFLRRGGRVNALMEESSWNLGILSHVGLDRCDSDFSHLWKCSYSSHFLDCL